MIATSRIEILFCEFGSSRGSHGGVSFAGNRLDPSLSSFRKYFPNAHVRVITDDAGQFSGVENIEIQEVQPKFDKQDPRWGYRCSDYYRVVGMLDSKYDTVIYTDTDMFVCNEKIYQAISMSNIFGLCVPANPRTLLQLDVVQGNDIPVHEEQQRLVLENGAMFSFNSSPLFFSTSHEKARGLLEAWETSSRIHSTRSPVAINAASLATGYFPCLLPYQWCVSRENIDNEIILHVGKQEIAKKYFGSQ